MQNNYKVGLKLWSINTDCYYKEAKKIYDQSFFDYIELYVVPDTLETISKWKKLNIPFIIHAPHSLHGFNLALAEKEQFNLKLADEAKKFADILGAEYIIFHGGCDGSIEEVIRQINLLKESRGLIENKPFFPISNALGLKECRGASTEEIELILNNTDFHFCLDIAHAVCFANAFGFNPYEYIAQFEKLQPKMYHISDGDIHGKQDCHLNFQNGTFDFLKIFSLVRLDTLISIETFKKSKENLDDFRLDCQRLIRFMNEYDNIARTDRK